MEVREVFEAKWNKFVDLVKGQMIIQSGNKKLNFAIAKLILSDAVSFWAAGYEEGGRWLKEFSDADPRRGALLRDILTSDLKFSEVKVSSGISPLAAGVSSLACGAVGFGISTLCNANIWVKIASTALPPALVFPSIKTASKAVAKQGQKKVINSYIEQLDKFKKAALTVLG